MENLSIKKENTTIISNLIRVGDLAYFEGPLLALFEEGNSGHLYIFDWADRNDKYNRWLVYRISPLSVLAFMKGDISHLDLFERTPDKKFYVADIETNYKITDYNLLELNDVPLKYYPNKESYFDIDDCPSFSKIQSIVFKALSRKKQENEYFVSDILRPTLTINTISRERFNRVNKSNVDTYFGNETYNVNLPSNFVVEFKNRYDQTKALYSNINLNSRQLKRKKVYA